MLNAGTRKKNESPILLLKKNGISFALLAYSYGLNGFSLPDSSDYSVNLITRRNIRNDLAKADSLNPDFIIVYFHYGTEYSREPDAFQLDYTNYAFRHGADIVIGSHPHVIQTAQVRKAKRIPLGFVAYSLGNFISNQRWRYSDCGVILNFTVRKNLLKKRTRLSNVDFIPVWVYKGTVDSTGKQGYRIYAETDSLATKSNPYLTEEDLLLMKQAFDDTREVLQPINEIMYNK